MQQALIAIQTVADYSSALRFLFGPGSSYFAPLTILELVSATADASLTWLVTHNLESFCRVLYALLHPHFNARLHRIDSEKLDLILQEWRQEVGNMGAFWQQLFRRVASNDFHDPTLSLKDALVRCNIECIGWLALIHVLPNVTLSVSYAPASVSIFAHLIVCLV
jgi:hypothetical protein